MQCIHGLLACQFGIEAVGAALQLEADGAEYLPPSVTVGVFALLQWTLGGDHSNFFHNDDCGLIVFVVVYIYY